MSQFSYALVLFNEDGNVEFYWPLAFIEGHFKAEVQIVGVAKCLKLGLKGCLYHGS